MYWNNCSVLFQIFMCVIWFTHVLGTT